MPFLNSYADVIRDWESLLNACKKNAELLLGMDPVIAPLDQVLLKMKDLKNQQEQLEGVRKATTQQLQQLRDEGYEAAACSELRARATGYEERAPRAVQGRPDPPQEAPCEAGGHGGEAGGGEGGGEAADDGVELNP